MKTRSFRVAVVMLVVVVSAGRGFAQAPAVQGAQAHRATVVRTADVPTIDGVLDERVWQQAALIDEFVQIEPAEGQPATEKTEVRLLYTPSAIYVGVICFDSEPSRIVTTDSRRDSGLNGQDSFQMIFDTYHDRQNGFIFGTNAVGIEYDAQVRNEGETLRGGPPGGLGGGNTGGAGARGNRQRGG
jgi:hypothetical protein